MTIVKLYTKVLLKRGIFKQLIYVMLFMVVMSKVKSFTLIGISHHLPFSAHSAASCTSFCSAIPGAAIILVSSANILHRFVILSGRSLISNVKSEAQRCVLGECH